MFAFALLLLCQVPLPPALAALPDAVAFELRTIAPDVVMPAAPARDEVFPPTSLTCASLASLPRSACASGFCQPAASQSRQPAAIRSKQSSQPPPPRLRGRWRARRSL